MFQSEKLKSVSAIVVALIVTCFATPIQAAAPVAGLPGGALQFSGSQNVTMNRVIQDDFTIEFWLKTSVSSSASGGASWIDGYGLVTARQIAAANDFGVTLANGRIRFGIGTAGATITSAVTVSDNNWHHVAARRVKTTGELFLYVDGVASSNTSGASTASLTGASGMQIGSVAGNNFFTGQIDEVRLWNSASFDPTDLWRASMAGDEPNLVTYFRLDEASGATATDSSSGANNGTLQANPARVQSLAGINEVIATRGINRLVTLTGYDADAQTLTATIQTRPSVGKVFQNTGGNPGAEIAVFPGVVTDAGRRIFINAPQAGNGSFTYTVNDGSTSSPAATVNVRVKDLQTITFDQPAEVAFSPATILLNAYSSSGLPVTLTIVSGTATLNGNYLSINQTNPVVVRATQAGNNRFVAAAPVTRTINLGTFKARLVYDNDFDDAVGDYYYDPPRKCLFVDAAGSVYVTGTSGGDFDDDIATVKFRTTGSIEWSRTYDSGDYDTGGPITVDANGNVYTAGYFSVAGGPGASDIVVLKYTSAGAPAAGWPKTYHPPGSTVNYAAAIAVDTAGNVHVAVASRSAATGDDILILKYDSTGAFSTSWPDLSDGKNLLGVRYYDGPEASAIRNSDTPYAMVVDAQSNVYVTGTSESVNPASSYVTIKYNSSGARQWVAKYFTENETVDGFPYDSTSSAYDIAVDASGSTYVTGYSGGYNTDWATVKYDANGVEQWVRRYGSPGTETEYAYALAIDSAANVYVCGSSATSSTTSGMFTIKYNTAGDEQWSAFHPNYIDFEQGVAIAVDSGGGVYAVGKTGDAEQSDYLTIKYDANGKQQWEHRYDGAGNTDDYPAAVAVDSAFTVYVCGAASSVTDLDYVTLRLTQSTQTITFNAIPDHFVGDIFALSASSDAGLPVSFSVISGPATITGNLLTVTGEGGITVRASQAGAGTVVAAANVDRAFNATTPPPPKTTPTITWANPAAISEGTPLSATQLNATTSVPGTFQYFPPAGTKLGQGNNQPLFTEFTPTDTASFNTATAIVFINVGPAPVKLDPVITWTNPAEIFEGTALSATQLNATANVPGTFAYFPPSGTVLGVGQNQTLVTIFTPTDTGTYNTAAKAVTINVNAQGTGGGGLAFASQAIALPNPGTAGELTQFIAVAIGGVGALSYDWNFGDASTGTGATTAHIYALPGTYAVSVTVSDTASHSLTQNFNVQMLTADGQATAPATDTDGDGFDNELETALGSNPQNAADIPGDANLVEIPLPDIKMAIKLNFSKPANDSITVSGTILLPEGLRLVGKKAIFYVGGVKKEFTLDVKGGAKVGGDSIAIADKGGPTRTAKFSVKLTKGDFADELLDEQLTNTDVAARSVHIRVALMIENFLFQTLKTQVYTAKANKSGATK